MHQLAGQQEKEGRGVMGFFDISLYGVPVAIFGMIYMMLFAPLLLPGKANERRTSGEHHKVMDLALFVFWDTLFFSSCTSGMP